MLSDDDSQQMIALLNARRAQHGGCLGDQPAAPTDYFDQFEGARLHVPDSPRRRRQDRRLLACGGWLIITAADRADRLARKRWSIIRSLLDYANGRKASGRHGAWHWRGAKTGDSDCQEYQWLANAGIRLCATLARPNGTQEYQMLLVDLQEKT